MASFRNWSCSKLGERSRKSWPRTVSNYGIDFGPQSTVGQHCQKSTGRLFVLWCHGFTTGIWDTSDQTLASRSSLWDYFQRIFKNDQHRVRVLSILSFTIWTPQDAHVAGTVKCFIKDVQIIDQASYLVISIQHDQVITRTQKYSEY